MFGNFALSRSKYSSCICENGSPVLHRLLTGRHSLGCKSLDLNANFSIFWAEVKMLRKEQPCQYYKGFPGG